MNKKLSVKFQLTLEEREYIERYQMAHHLSSRSAALEFILDEHCHKQDISVTDCLTRHLVEELLRELEPRLKKLQLGVNHTDQTAAINQLLLNTLAGYSGLRSLAIKDTPQLTEARQRVKEKIIAGRTKSLDDGSGY